MRKTTQIANTINRNPSCNKSDQPRFNKSCIEKRNEFTLQKNRYSFVRKKENRDAMNNICKEM